MQAKLDSEQKRQIKELKKKIRQENKYVPRGQGDGINRHLTIQALCREIDRVKSDPSYKSNRLW